MKYFDVQALSVLLSVKPKTIYDWVHREVIPYHKFGKLVRFEEKEIIKWLDERKHVKRQAVSL